MSSNGISKSERELLGVESIPISREEESRLRSKGRKIIGALEPRHRPSGPAKAHEFIVGQLVGQGAQVGGFVKALRSEFDLDDEDIPVTGIRPDAFTITADEVCIYEVEVTSRMTQHKLDMYAELWGILDFDHSAFCRLFLISFSGDVREFDLPDLYFRNARGNGEAETETADE